MIPYLFQIYLQSLMSRDVFECIAQIAITPHLMAIGAKCWKMKIYRFPFTKNDFPDLWSSKIRASYSQVSIVGIIWNYYDVTNCSILEQMWRFWKYCANWHNPPPYGNWRKMFKNENLSFSNQQRWFLPSSQASEVLK